MMRGRGIEGAERGLWSACLELPPRLRDELKLSSVWVFH